MVTFEKWLVKTLENNCGFLKISRDGTIYSIPYDRGIENFFEVNTGTLTLKNLLTDERDSFPISDVFNVEVFSMGNYEESLKVTLNLIDSRLTPILSEPLQRLTHDGLLKLIFLEGMNVNYIRVMDFMGYSSPLEFNKVYFDRYRLIHSISEDTLAEVYENYSSVVNKRMDMIVADMNRNLGEDALPIVTDIRRNVEDFLANVRNIPPGKLQAHWPSLINPSPYYLQPRVALKDG